jgi:hypothetical protein
MCQIWKRNSDIGLQQHWKRAWRALQSGIKVITKSHCCQSNERCSGARTTLPAERKQLHVPRKYDYGLIVKTIGIQQEIHHAYSQDAVLIPFRHDVIFHDDDLFEGIADFEQRG